MTFCSHYSHTKRQLQHTSQKITTHHFACSPRFRAPHFSPTSSLLLSSLGSYHPRRYALAPVSASCFSSLLLGMSVSLMPMHLWLACIHYMHALHLASTTVHASLLYLYTSHLVLRVTMHLLHTIHYTTALYLYSVLLGRARSAVVLQRLPNIRCLSCLLCTCSTSSRTGIRE